MVAIVYGVKAGRLLTTPIDWAKCGTPSQARAHQRRGERPCAKCLQAEHRRKSSLDWKAEYQKKLERRRRRHAAVSRTTV